MKLLILLIIFLLANSVSRVIDIIDIREIEDDNYNFKLSNHGSLFNLDSSKYSFYNKLDSIQYIKDAGFIFSAFTNEELKLISSIPDFSEAIFFPGITKYGKKIDSTQKVKYSVYSSKDYDKNGIPLFGEPISNWPIYKYTNQENGSGNPIYIDSESERNKSDFIEPFFFGDYDLFSVYKASLDDVFIQVENLISFYENQIIIQYKLINSGVKLDSALFSFYLDPDITHHKRIFQEIYDDEFYFDEIAFVNDENNTEYKTIGVSTVHFPKINDENEVIHPFLSDLENEKIFSANVNDLFEQAKDLRKYQGSEQLMGNFEVNDTKILINNNMFNFAENDTVFFAYSIDIVSQESNLDQTFNKIKSDLENTKTILQNLFTSIEQASKNLEFHNFNIYTVDGKLIAKNTNTIAQLPKGLYILIDNNSHQIKKILVD
ncbi:hypothetical protein OAQ99_04615 [Candidatus Kapabacteria bacterium]|nr:hypothetical protein [Candidatus Kapabacteria bacterium]